MKTKTIKSVQVGDKEKIKTLLLTNEVALRRGILRIFERQTQDEQRSHNTHYHNGIGFSASDAKFLSDMAALVRNNRAMSEGQLIVSRRKMVKYANQLLNIMLELKEGGKQWAA